ncbi:MAG: hypothetical protein K2Y23_13450 [Cyanobacteria bacterium]|nr:hypothetical protein [Cyanobacteriota bacterium]
MTGVNSGNGGERLDSWKAIATYLGRDEGTLRRWERTRGLPIRRVPGRKGASVYAFTSEIDAWLQADPPETESGPSPATVPVESVAEPASRRRSGPILAAALVAVVGISGWWLTRPAASAEQFTIEINEASITARNANGSTIWTHELGDQYRHILSEIASSSRIVGTPRSRVYVATANRFRRTDNYVEGGRVMAFDFDGEPQWTFEFDDTLTIGGKPFGAPWGLAGFAVEGNGAARKIAVAAHHWTWSASLIAVLDDEGRRLGTYVNDGWLEQVHWLAPDRLVVGGFSQSRNGGLVALLDPAALDGQTPEENPAHQCQNCRSGRPLRLAVMPRTELNLATGSRFNRASLEHLGDRVLVRTVEMPASDQSPAEAIYEFTPNLDLVSASFSERYWEAHDQLFARKQIDHDRAHCPDRDGPRSYQAWSPERGWITQSIR